jgi:hypothetical protein
MRQETSMDGLGARLTGGLGFLANNLLVIEPGDEEPPTPLPEQPLDVAVADAAVQRARAAEEALQAAQQAEAAALAWKDKARLKMRSDARRAETVQVTSRNHRRGGALAGVCAAPERG